MEKLTKEQLKDFCQKLNATTVDVIMWQALVNQEFTLLVLPNGNKYFGQCDHYNTEYGKWQFFRSTAEDFSTPQAAAAAITAAAHSWRLSDEKITEGKRLLKMGVPDDAFILLDAPKL